MVDVFGLGVLSGVLGNLAFAIGVKFGTSPYRKIWVRSMATRTRVRVRVSCGVLLRVEDHDEDILLWQAGRREGVFVPPGGVIKAHLSGQERLADLDFVYEQTSSDAFPAQRDLRGQLSYRKLRPFLKWYESGEGRETIDECMNRELDQESAEVGISSGLPFGSMRTIRRVLEGPFWDGERNEYSLRILDVVELNDEWPTNSQLRDQLIETPDQTRRARFFRQERLRTQVDNDDNHVLGSNCRYLITGEVVKPRSR